MSEPVQFDYELPGGGILEVTALVTPGRPQVGPGWDGPGEPAEGPDIEITDCFLKDPNENNPDLPFDPDGLWFRNRDKNFKQILDDMEGYAWDAYTAAW